MNRTFPFLFSVLLAAASLSAAVKDKEPISPGKKPELKLDSSAVSDGKMVVTSYADIVEPVQKTVVSVYSSKTVHQRAPLNPLFRQFFPNAEPDQERDSKIQGLGSGVIVSSEGYVLTNNHVVEGADELKVRLTDGREYVVKKIVGADPKTDIAVIKIEETNLPAITLADSDKLRVGDVVFAIGNPLEVGQTVTMGIISALKRRDLKVLEDVQGYEDFIQTDAAINLGNSGGALIDAKGRLIGINTAIISPTSTNIGIGFAIPVNLAASIMTSLVQTGSVQRGFLGVGADAVTPELAESLGLPTATKGVIVTNLSKDGPAEKAGIKREDVILAIDDKRVTTLQELRLVVAQIPPDSKVSVKVLRGKETQTIQVVLSKLTEDVADATEVIPGVKLSKLNDDLRKQYRIPNDVEGLVVTESGRDATVPEGAVVMKINRQETKEIADAAAALRKPGSGRNVALIYYRGGYTYVTFPAK